MITLDLIEYIKSQLSKNISKDLITSQLSEAGWRMEDIEEGFSSVLSEQSTALPISSEIEGEKVESSDFYSNNLDQNNKENLDPYREVPELGDLSLEKKDEFDTPIMNTIDKLEPMRIWAPIRIEPKTVEVKEEEKETLVQSVEVFSPELNAGENMDKLEGIEESLKKEIISKKESDIEFLPQFSLGAYNIEQKATEPIATSEGDLIPTINKNLLPDASRITNLPPRKIQNIKPSPSAASMLDIVPRTAMISSYSQDILAAKDEEVPKKPKKNKLLKWIIITLTLVIVSGVIFAFVEGSVNVPFLNINFSIVEKNPKVTIINTPSSLSKLDSYKVETEINITAPSLSSITTGLSSGVATNSSDVDSILIKTNGLISHVAGESLFDYSANLKSSILKDEINTNIKYDGSELYVEIPNLSEVVGVDAPKKTTVSMQPKQIKLINAEFSEPIQKIVNNVDIDKIFSKEFMSSFGKSNLFIDFINTLEYTEKNAEKVDGIDMYHYNLMASRQETKKLLVSASDIILKKISDEGRKKLEEVLGASTITSFEVWIGESDNNLYQFKFTLNSPLSRILNLNDSGIAGNEVKLTWVTKYKDLNIPNSIDFPKTTTSIEDFINKIKDSKIKNIISSFKPQANSLRNSIGSFGTRLNPAGNCVNPNPGSLFSPLGHIKGASGAISSISSSMNLLLTETNGLGSCYSTSNSWALSVPMFSSSNDLVPSFYCADNTGRITTLTSPISGSVCK